jgi:N-formylglutamate amidohydrolase
MGEEVVKVPFVRHNIDPNRAADRRRHQELQVQQRLMKARTLIDEALKIQAKTIREGL